MAQRVALPGRAVMAVFALALAVFSLAAADGASATSWANQTSGESGLRLLGVSCASVTNCWAVGSFGFVLTTTDGLTWSGGQSAHTSDWINGVSCPTTSRCWAVTQGGKVEAMTITTNPDGTQTTTWSQQTTAPLGSFLSGVSCPTASNCWAVGASGQIIETSDAGSMWQPQVSGTTNALYGIGCCTRVDEHMLGWRRRRNDPCNDQRRYDLVITDIRHDREPPRRFVLIRNRL